MEKKMTRDEIILMVDNLIAYEPSWLARFFNDEQVGSELIYDVDMFNSVFENHTPYDMADYDFSLFSKDYSLFTIVDNKVISLSLNNGLKVFLNTYKWQIVDKVDKEGKHKEFEALLTDIHKEKERTNH